MVTPKMFDMLWEMRESPPTGKAGILGPPTVAASALGQFDVQSLLARVETVALVERLASRQAQALRARRRPNQAGASKWAARRSLSSRCRLREA